MHAPLFLFYAESIFPLFRFKTVGTILASIKRSNILFLYTFHYKKISTKDGTR